AERCERVQRRREPCVEHILFLAQLGRPAFRARRRLGLCDRDVAVGAVPDRDPLTPPDLARDAPVADVLHPVEVDAREPFGREADATLLDRGYPGRGELPPPHSPLRPPQPLIAPP